ncbi:MAG: alanyl-tRNA editing protein [Gammaproteobacteria bacterium]|nr:alanyl-tRNA editing protein [Gammaproteobacteria bacterium]
MPETHQAYDDDSYLSELDASVTAVDGGRVELDATIFYPTGGGQPGDTGRFTTGDGRTVTVVDTLKGDAPGRILHIMEAEDHGLSPGETIHMTLDWDRRYRHMRMHTALHVLGSLIPVPVTGWCRRAQTRAGSTLTSASIRSTRTISQRR